MLTRTVTSEKGVRILRSEPRLAGEHDLEGRAYDLRGNLAKRIKRSGVNAVWKISVANGHEPNVREPDPQLAVHHEHCN